MTRASRYLIGETLVNPVGQYHATLDVVETDTNHKFDFIAR